MPEMTFAAVDIPDVTALREAVIPPRMPYKFLLSSGVRVFPF